MIATAGTSMPEMRRLMRKPIARRIAEGELRTAQRASRRAFLADVGMGFTGLALGAMLAREGIVRGSDVGHWPPPDGNPQFAPKVKSVIWIFQVGGMSHMASFYPKPALTEYAGRTIAESPFKSVLDSPFLKKNL